MKLLEKVRTNRIFLSAFLLCVGVLFGTQVLAVDQEGSPTQGREYSVPSWKGESSAACHRPGTAREYMRYRMYNRIRHALKQIDLTDSQKRGIHQIRISLEKDMIMKRADLRIAKLEFREQLCKEPVDMSTLESQVKKIEGLKAAMILNAIKAWEDIKSTLTPEQRKKLAELLQISLRHHHGAHAGA